MILLPVVAGIGFVGISCLLQKLSVQHSISHSGKVNLSSENKPLSRAQAAFLSVKSSQEPIKKLSKLEGVVVNFSYQVFLQLVNPAHKRFFKATVYFTPKA